MNTDRVTEKLVVKKNPYQLEIHKSRIGFKIFYPLPTMGKIDETGLAKTFMKL